MVGCGAAWAVTASLPALSCHAKRKADGVCVVLQAWTRELLPS